jgi:rubrerythrin
MEDLNVTAATIISFAEKVEDNSAAFYEELARRFPQSRDDFLAFARESKKNKVMIVRTYQETITDALEACFSFEGLNLQPYVVKGISGRGNSYIEALQDAVELEGKAGRFYSDAAGHCASFLATIPRVFRRIAEARNKRRLELESLIGQGG